MSISDYISPEMGESYEVAGQKKEKKTKGKKGTRRTNRFLFLRMSKAKHEAFSLQEVLDVVRKQAHKGMHVQRYKGFG